MTHSIPYSPVLSALLCVLLILAACERPAEREQADEEFPMLGHWLLDEDTRDWLPRACVVLDIRNTDEASLELIHVEDEALVRLNDVRATTFAGPIQTRNFTGRQLLPTTSTGRFCGSEIIVQLRMRLVSGDPDRLEGVWQTPGCELCPDRRFGAVRVSQ